MPFAVLASRLPESSKIRGGLHAALRTADATVGQLVRQPPQASDGRQRHDPGRAETVPASDTDAEREAIAEAVRERQPNVGELADPDLDVAEVQAQLQAKHAIEMREENEQSPDATGRRRRTKPTGR
jgi:hypothetical protein